MTDANTRTGATSEALLVTSESEMIRVTAAIAVGIAREIRELAALKEEP